MGGKRNGGKETLEILEESEGDNDKGRIFMDATKKLSSLTQSSTLALASPANQ